MKLGKLNLEIISDGNYSIDGGAMFGTVPRTIWSKESEPDSINRVLLGLNCLLIQDGKQNILIDTGIGDKFSEKLKVIYAVDHYKTLLESLAPFCLPQDISWVIFTHLHLDHAGGASYYDQDGQLKLTFPNANYLIQKAEWEAAHNPDDRSRPSYLKENIGPLAASGRINLIEGDYKFNENIELILTPSHSFGHQAVKISSVGQTAFFGGDIFPTSAHLKPNYLPAYDIDPLKTIEWKKKFLEAAARENWLFIWEHNPRRAISRIIEKDGKFQMA